MYCYSCGSEIPDDAAICPNCGVSINNNHETTPVKTDKPVKKIVLGAIAIIVIIILVSGVIGLTSQTSDEPEEIKLIKISNDGYTSSLSGKTVYCYFIDGVIKGLPDDATGYSAKGSFYDSTGHLVKEADSYLDLDYLNDNDFKNSESTTLFYIETDYLSNITDVEIVIYDPEGEIVLNETVDYKMENFDLN